MKMNEDENTDEVQISFEYYVKKIFGFTFSLMDYAYEQEWNAFIEMLYKKMIEVKYDD
jgi:hypothetical protein